MRKFRKVNKSDLDVEQQLMTTIRQLKCRGMLLSTPDLTALGPPAISKYFSSKTSILYDSPL